MSFHTSDTLGMESMARIWSIFKIPMVAFASSIVTTMPAFLKIFTNALTGGGGVNRKVEIDPNFYI
ncbi:hypothetical protein L3i20_v216270 [Paenibacillus sp. L3-i20]|nr:hypothetical protein L3i20_v216270 [Paenibacillus sp. L3-i20]